MRIYRFAFPILLLLYIAYLPLDVLEVDAAQYASIAREMNERGDFLQVYHRGEDYLDKPPLLFWLASLSFSMFGVSTWAYKLPAFLALLLALISTYRFTKIWYSAQTALLATLLLGSSQAFFLLVNDVRTDGLLLSALIGSLAQISDYWKNKKNTSLLLAAFFVGLGMLAKGPIALVFFGFAVGGHVLVRREWKLLFSVQWFSFLGIILLVLLPMCIGLYQQFDLHPEKTVYGLQGPSGLEFYFWTQSFGRITGEIYWKNDTSFLYFFHTILWDFQPWILFLIPALFYKITRFRQSTEWMSLAVFILGFASLSLSNYKLPHYIFPLLPFSSILLADYLVSTSWKNKAILRLQKLHFASLHVFFFLLVCSLFFFFDAPNSWFIWLVGIGWLLLSSIPFLFRSSWQKTVISGLIASLFFTFSLRYYLYPAWFSYQSTSILGKEIHAQKWPVDRIFCYRVHGHSLDFYAQRIIPFVTLSSLEKNTYIYTDVVGKKEIEANWNGNIEVMQTFSHFPVSKLTVPFLRKDTREQTLETRYLLLIQ